MSTKTLLLLAVAAAVAYFLFMKKGAAGVAGARGAVGVAGAASPSTAQQLETLGWGIAKTQLNNIFGGGSDGAQSPAGNLSLGLGGM